MSLNRYSAKRDENEPGLVRFARKYGRAVALIKDATPNGFPDLVIMRPGPLFPVYSVRDRTDMAAVLANNDRIALVEVKMPGKRLNAAQREFFKMVDL